MNFPSKRFVVLTALLTILLSPAFANAQSSHEQIQAFFQNYFEARLKSDPEFATGAGHYENAGQWTDWSSAGIQSRRKDMETGLQELAKFSLASLPEADQLSARLLQYDLKSQLESYDLETYLLRVGQLYGLHNRFFLLYDRMPARNESDYEHFLSRLHGSTAYVDQNIALLNQSISLGLTQPKIVIDLVINQISAQSNQNAASSPLLLPFRNFPSSFSDDQKKKLAQEATSAFNTEFLPAWRKLLAFMQTTYAPKARPQIGLGTLKDSPQLYQILIRRLTTTNATPEEIHKIGESEVARIESLMGAVMKEANFSGSIEDFQKQLNASPEQHFQSKEEMLIYCRNVAKIIEPELPKQFKTIPLLLYGIRAIPPDREQATASNAQAPSPDGSVPGWFNLNTYQPEKQVRYDKQALVLHEAVPGHIFQVTLARGLTGLPQFQRFYSNSAFAEGWALYTESLGSQLGVYNDPYSRFGQLSSERFRAVRLVVDTGMHAMGWSRDRALAYFKEHCPEETEAEIDRYISWPAQALSYKMGQLKFVSLRKEAEQKLGGKFDVREFHDAVLKNGILPLDLLQDQGEKFIAAH